MRLPLAAATAALALLVPGTALAATPATGEVSKDKSTQKWSGQATSSFVQFVPTVEDTRCDAPFCDEHTLEVKDSGKLTLVLNSPDSAMFVDMRVTTPDGEVTVFGGNDTEKVHTEVFDDAAVGTWKIAIYNNALAGLNTGDYTGKATLVVPAPDVKPTT